MRIDERILRRVLITIPLAGLGAGLAAWFSDHSDLAQWAFGLGTAPVIASLAISIIRDLLAGRMGVDAVAFLSMVAALALGQSLAGVIVAIMYAGGNLLEDFAVGRAERDLKALIDRAPRLAHRKSADTIEDVPIDKIAIWDAILVRAGEVVPIDGKIISAGAMIDEAALTGEPIPVLRSAGDTVSSGTINAGETFEMQATATAGDSTYAGIVRMVTAAQTAKAPFIRMADRYALLLLPITLCVAGAAWGFSSDPIRALAVLVAATPCPLILAAPAAFIGGTSQAARRGVLVKGGGPLEALARIHTVMFDKTGTLTVGGARLVAIETAPGGAPDEALRLAASLEQASHHVLAATIVATGRSKGLSLEMPEDVREVLGSGLEGVIEGRRISVGSLQFVHGEGRLEEWARRAARRASWRSALTVFVAVDGRVIAVLLFADELRRETPRAIQALRTAGVARIVMVTGDRSEPAETIGAALDLDAVLADRVPSDKVDAVVTERRLAPTLMVGDGINDAPALAAADVGMAMGARGASASSEAADVVVLVDRLDRVAEAVAIARRTRGIAMQSMISGMALSGVTMIAAALGYVTPIAGALIQEAIDVAVILNALRALTPPGAFEQPSMSEAAAGVLREDHERLESSLERLRQIADALDSAESAEAVDYILEANQIIETVIVKHERDDEETIYPRVSRFLTDDHGLSAMSRAHREILHQARLLGRLSEGLRPNEAEPYLVRDAQRIIETLESLVHIHNVQEEDIYEHAVAQLGREAHGERSGKPIAKKARGATAFEQALAGASKGRHRWSIPASALIVIAIAGGAVYWGGQYFSRVNYGPPPAESALATVTATAKVSAVTATPIDAKTSGAIEAVYCNAGAFVTKGQLCAKIDPRPYQLMVEQDEAALKLANDRLEKAKSQLAQAHATYERNQNLASRKADAKKVLETAQKVLEKKQAQVMHDQTSVAIVRGALRAAEINLEHTDIIAPIDGIVVSQTAEVAREVTIGKAEPLFIVVPDLGVVIITVRVDQGLAHGIRPGDNVSFRLELLPDHSFQGVVTQISLAPRIIDGAANYDLIISAPNPDLLLKPGVLSTVEMTIGPARAFRRPTK
jgi:heavy metal translocating P-type ATPase/RND family efflux transporter MFP subunit